jgi:maltose alpha-D-glucosyltransferase/alpha-amylase
MQGRDATVIDLWYKNAVIYCLDVKTFMDSDGDGMGDFRGLADRLDHIEALGANCLWLLPFHPSPDRDNGYDITDYYAVDPRLGSLGDFVEFTRAARERGLRIIVDLVVNHTSMDHPWFQEARSSRDSPRRDWYVWSDKEPENRHEGMVFPGQQEATWTWDETAGAWYMHRFYEHQPDLNIANPAVREEIARIMGFWLQLGATGFRLDAVPFLIEYRGVQAPEGRSDPHHYLVELRDFLDWREAESVLLAEANIEMEDLDEYFGAGERQEHDLQLHAEPEPVPGARPRRGGAGRAGDAGHAGDPVDRAMGHLPTQPRRAGPRPPVRCGTRGGLRGLRTG